MKRADLARPRPVGDATLLRGATREMRRAAKEEREKVQSRRLQAYFMSLAALKIMCRALGGWPAEATLTAEGAWGTVRGHTLFVPVSSDVVWRWTAQGWRQLRLSDLMVSPAPLALPPGTDPWPVWGVWRRYMWLNDTHKLLTMTVLLLGGLMLLLSPMPVLSVGLIGVPLLYFWLYHSEFKRLDRKLPSRLPSSGWPAEQLPEYLGDED